KYDLIFNSYIYPKYIGRGSVPPNVLRINYQTDRVLKYRGNLNPQYARKLHLKKEEKMDAILTTTKFSIPLIKKEHPILSDSIYYCPNFLPKLNPISSETLDKKINNYPIKILFLGRDGKRKGLFEFINAISRLDEEHRKKIKVFIVSENKFNHSILKDIDFVYKPHLPHSEALNLMKNVHIFCMPTKSDSYGLVFIEAMSKGCAVIADDDLPRLEMIKNNNCGLCINPNKINQIKNALKQLILDEQLRETYMQNSLKTFKSEYSPESVAKKHKKIFYNVINKNTKKDK
ncbi:MAG: glycosyltransferase family 4 protein, partial [archaeon]